jgi:hypothetical protein
MKRLLLPAGLAFSLLADSAFAVVPVAPPTPVPAPARARPVLPPRPPFARDNQLIETGGFEMPRVTGRMPKELPGGNFLKFAQGEWVQFSSSPKGVLGGMTAGLTNDIAHSGRQSLYVSFDHVKEPLAAVYLSTDLIPVKAGSPYHVSIWGRIDRKNPITLDQRVPVLRLQAEFFTADHETQTGETIVKVQPIPGTPNRPLMFTSERWTEYFADLTPPEDGAFIKVTWVWSTTSDAGVTNGIAYFDDATIEGEKVEPVETPEPTDEKPPGTPAAPGAPAAPDAATPASPAPAPAAAAPAK